MAMAMAATVTQRRSRAQPAGTLLAGHIDHGEPLTPGAVEWIDADLDDAQRDAVLGPVHAGPCLIQAAGQGNARCRRDRSAGSRRGERVPCCATPAPLIASSNWSGITNLCLRYREEILCPGAKHVRRTPPRGGVTAPAQEVMTAASPPATSSRRRRLRAAGRERSRPRAPVARSPRTRRHSRRGQAEAKRR